MFCIQCGQQIEEGSQFCSHCGAQTTPEAGQAPEGNTPVPTSERQANRQPAKRPAVNMPAQHYAGPPRGGIDKSRRLIMIAAVAALVLVAVGATFFMRGRGEDYVPVATAPETTPQDQEEPVELSTLSLEHIERVVYGRLSGYPNVDVGEAFMAYFQDFRWDHFLDGQIHVVSFVGVMQYEGEPTTAQVLFRFTADDSAFSASGLHIEGIVQERSRMYELLDMVFESAGG